MKHGGYEVARKALALDHDAIIKEVTDSGLRGRGGAGVGTGFKWNAVPKNWDDPALPGHQRRRGRAGNGQRPRIDEQDAPHLD